MAGQMRETFLICLPLTDGNGKIMTQRAGEMLPSMKLPGPRDGRGAGTRSGPGKNANCQRTLFLRLDCWHDILGTGPRKKKLSRI